MTDKQICKGFLTEVLSDEIEEISEITSQKAVLPDSTVKAVYLDIVVKNTKTRMYAIEMRMVNQGNLEKRGRYYQTAIDMRKTSKNFSF